MPSVAPTVTYTSVAGSYDSPYRPSRCTATASRSSGSPGPGGYWFAPERIASTAASSTPAGPGSSGKPWPRLMDPVRTARADISAKIVSPNSRMRSTSGSLTPQD